MAFFSDKINKWYNR